jgi:hypothetical protein
MARESEVVVDVAMCGLAAQVLFDFEPILERRGQLEEVVGHYQCRARSRQ